MARRGAEELRSPAHGIIMPNGYFQRLTQFRRVEVWRVKPSNAAEGFIERGRDPEAVDFRIFLGYQFADKSRLDEVSHEDPGLIDVCRVVDQPAGMWKHGLDSSAGSGTGTTRIYSTTGAVGIANDFDFEGIFARQIEALGRSGDVLLGISTSGNSANVVAAVERAKSMDLRTIVLTGAGGRLKNLADVAIRIPSESTQHIQEAHLAVEHLLCHLVERELFPNGGKAFQPPHGRVYERIRLHSATG
jgi:SIS domain